MIKKAFITDCEGPLSLNDNAYEIAKEFIPEGDKLFKIISKFDDYLVDVVKKPNYYAGDTLKLITPFFKLYNVSNQDIIDFSRNNIFLVPGAKETLKLAKIAMDSFIVSTSYGQYIEALSNYVDFPYENTYYTQLDMDIIDLLDIEKEKLIEFKNIILESESLESESKNNQFEILDNIFFNEIPKMKIAKLTESVKTVGGHGKKLAIDDIIAKHNIDKKGIMYVGDSITDTNPLKFAKDNGGIAISFNGNEFALREAEIAIISNHTIATSLFIELHSKFNKEYIMEFVRSYNKDPKRAFESFRFGYKIIDDFNEVFDGKELPIIKIITDENREELINESRKMRKDIRGKDIGSLG